MSLLLTEDLSPHKIALLVLVVLYLMGKIPSHQTQTVLYTLNKLLENEPLRDENNEFIVVPLLADLCRSLGSSVAKLALLDSENIDDIQKLLLGTMWSIGSVESLNSYITGTHSLLLAPLAVTGADYALDSPKLMSPRSFIGDFIQKIFTTFKLLHFDEESLLYDALVEYRESSRGLYESLVGKPPHVPQKLALTRPRPSQSVFASDKALFHHQHPQGALEEKDEALFSALNKQLEESLDITVPAESHSGSNKNVTLIPVPKHDLQALLEKQITLLETYGTETPQMLKDIMAFMASPDSNISLIQKANFNSLPAYFYLQYLENLHASDYHGAFQSLHQYFDYVVSRNSKYFYHFALISRATLHQYFGEDEKALDAIEEAISVARENKDNSTLTYILSWLFNFIRNKPELWKSQNFYQNNNELHLLDFLIKKSQTVSLLLYAMSNHFETVHIMNSGGPMNKYLESLLKATYISINDTVASFIKSAEMSATVWSRIGYPHLSDLYGSLAFDYSKKTGNFGDELSVEIRRNYFLYLKGQTEQAYKNLEKQRPKTLKDLSLYKSLQVRSLIILVNIDLRKGRYKYAERVMETLMETEVLEMELKTEIVYLNAEVQVALKNYSKALAYISSNLTYLESQHMKIQSNVHTILRLNLLKCKIFNSTGAHSRALSLVIQQIQQGKQLGFSTIVTEGLVLLVSLLNNMDSSEDAYEILRGNMAVILRVGQQECVSQAYYEFAKSCYKLVSEETNRLGMSQRDLFNDFLKFLNLGITGFKESLHLVMLKECFKLEELMADAYAASFNDEMRDSHPVDEFRQHSRAGLEILQKRAVEEADYGFVLGKV